jgi:hypothetical protein
MNEAIAAGILLISIIFIWKLVSGITINVTVKVPPIKTEINVPPVKVDIAMPPIKIENPITTIEVPIPQAGLYDENGTATSDNPSSPNPMTKFNQIFQGIEEIMKDE